MLVKRERCRAALFLPARSPHPFRVCSGRGRRAIHAVSGIVNFVLQIKMLVLGEDVSDVRNQLGLILDQRLRAFFLGGGRNTLAAENDGTHAQGRLAEIGDLHVGFK